jgi:hypothetical protein
MFRKLAHEIAPNDDLSIAQRLLLQRATIIACLCTHYECSMLLGERELPVGDYISMSTTLRRLLVAITDPRMKRALKDIGPSSFGELLRQDILLQQQQARDAAQP